ncbi:DUF1254 domain-containing protein [Pseudomonas mandelii]|uniref:DUF1254 domain-containing protein n=1 Tax=Pseudomonas mandelii TaxID=75612 RepID=A0A502HT29_9PSED|nr:MULTISPECIES: DUF1254 domain-containing protein [Pseudomonas]TPG77999.1 DUF1254 domain-containing protein [Pseudomonas mandelii]TPG86626.1 DUF1254 domain-containing protein [Pseudomonas caspiana]
MKITNRTFINGVLAAVLVATVIIVAGEATAQTSSAIPPAITTPDQIQTSLGTLEFKDGAPSKETVAKIYDNLDLMHGVEAFVNAYQGASVAAIFKGFNEAGVPDNTALIWSELMDSKSLFLTANADTIYFWVNLDVTNGPLVVETPPMSLGVIDDIWFRWVTDIGLPGPDRGEGGRYLLVPPDYKGILPENGYFVNRLRTNRATMLGRSFLENDDPKPAVALIKRTLKVYPYVPGGYGTSIGSALEGKATLLRTPEHKLEWSFLKPPPPVKFTEGSGKVMTTIPPSDFSYFEMINDLVQKEPEGSFDPEIMGSLAAIGIVKGKPFNPDTRMKKILTDAAAIGSATGRTLGWNARPSEGWFYYPGSAWTNMLFAGGYNFETPPPQVSADGTITPYPPTGYRMLNARTGFFFYATGITPAMVMRLTGIGSQYLAAFVDSKGDYFDGSKTYKMTLPPKIPAEKFWSLTLYDNQSRSMLDTPQRYPRAGSQSYPTPAAVANSDGSTTVYFAPSKPAEVSDGNWIQTVPGKGWSTILRFYSPLEPFFTKQWRPTEIELVK